ncbi:PREDICTED: uncharacterized protein LOC106790680 isoform X1 [Polistes canadensis]|uniref:uncharacterized protein LOC106790680 isoform X1 n=2 Tax=Polistes canadensis TaxID=91411 RepID=UPI000718D58B|nr:PREDICTED: uncharacterized protein LOC106790680 isoform X1 [Polistes canadensis]
MFEIAMDCCYIELNEDTGMEKVFPNVSSPEMFDSDVENEQNERQEITSINKDTLIKTSPEKPSKATLIAKSDNYLLVRINKYLTGVPPPPSHTICQSDCNDLLHYIQQNRQYFWTASPIKEENNVRQEENIDKSFNQETLENNKRFSFYKTNNTQRNLTSAFDECDSQTNNISNENKSLILYNSAGEKEVKNMPWSEAYFHKFHGIHYNRSNSIEEFENLTIKLCGRYIGAETQSTCNVFFSKQGPGSAIKRGILAKRNYGQSPGKRLSHLARRRRTFSSANLQGLNLNDKRQLVLTVKRPSTRKLKSPRGKSPRYKSPRGKSPRGSAKKKVVRRLTLENTSPLKTKLDTSRRVLFQSPTLDKPGPSKLFNCSNANPHTIKRALFPTPKKKEDVLIEGVKTITVEESRKRKSEEELQGPRFKWAKSLSFDCPYELQNSSLRSWDRERHSSGNVLTQHEIPVAAGKGELSDTHRKKLLWAVAEALRGRGIGMSHPQFKQYASDLARTVKKLMPDLANKNISRKPGSTSDRMLKLAKHHALLIIDTRPSE